MFTLGLVTQSTPVFVIGSSIENNKFRVHIEANGIGHSSLVPTMVLRH